MCQTSSHGERKKESKKEIKEKKERKKEREAYGVSCHFQQYFSYIVVVSLMFEETRVPGESHRPAASH